MSTQLPPMAGEMSLEELEAALAKGLNEYIFPRELEGRTDERYEAYLARFQRLLLEYESRILRQQRHELAAVQESLT